MLAPKAPKAEGVDEKPHLRGSPPEQPGRVGGRRSVEWHRMTSGEATAPENPVKRELGKKAAMGAHAAAERGCVDKRPTKPLKSFGTTSKVLLFQGVISASWPLRVDNC